MQYLLCTVWVVEINCLKNYTYFTWLEASVNNFQARSQQGYISDMNMGENTNF